MKDSARLRVSALSGALAVVLGAFGAHGLHQVLEHNQTVLIWEKAVFYHFIHTLMLFLLAGRRQVAVGPWYCFLAGIVVFSGSLYVLALTNLRWLGAITPVGGLSLIAGWLWLAFGAESRGEQDALR